MTGSSIVNWAKEVKERRKVREECEARNLNGRSVPAIDVLFGVPGAWVGTAKQHWGTALWIGDWGRRGLVSLRPLASRTRIN
jgi:hypothetical protein